MGIRRTAQIRSTEFYLIHHCRRVAEAALGRCCSGGSRNRGAGLHGRRFRGISNSSNESQIPQISVPAIYRLRLSITVLAQQRRAAPLHRRGLLESGAPVRRRHGRPPQESRLCTYSPKRIRARSKPRSSMFGSCLRRHQQWAGLVGGLARPTQ